jgi:hypothetical protein
MTYAFPHNTVVVDKEGGIVQHHKGMTLRDYFAAKAMQGYCSDPDWRQDMTPTDTAFAAYTQADAMMVAREK